MTMAYLATKIWDPEAYPLMLDEDGALTEGTQYNLFLVRGGQLFTPAASGILEGVSREIVMELAHDLDIKVAEQRLVRAPSCLQIIYDIYCAIDGTIPPRLVPGKTRQDTGRSHRSPSQR
jgi:hypothetical protein